MTDPEEFGSAVSGAKLTADFLASQASPTYVEQFQTPRWTLDFHMAHVKARIRAPLPPGWASLGLMRSPVAMSWYGTPAGQGVLVCTPPGEAIDGFITPGFTSLAVNVSPAVWEECRVVAGVERVLFGNPAMFQLPASLYAAVERQLRSLRSSLRHAATLPDIRAFAVRQAEEFVAFIATSAWELKEPINFPRESLRNRSRLALRAEEWMRGNLHEPVQMPDVCHAMRVSRRELEYAFRCTFNESPRSYLEALRLNTIRRTLRHADPGHDTVIHLAHAHGITHFGRFARTYRNLFGENPNLTLHKGS
jgi:AraC-like DNA-binding protein